MASLTVTFDRALFKSEAFRSLSGTQKTVLFDFLLKRRMGKAGKRGQWDIVNNGEIEYTYSEAEKKGIPRSTFMKTLDVLISRGFIDVSHSGNGGRKGDKSLYSISERWRKWGEKDFVVVKRPKDLRVKRGFAAHPEHRKNHK